MENLDFLEEPEAPDSEKITIEVDGESGRDSLKDRLMALNWRLPGLQKMCWRPVMIAYTRVCPSVAIVP